MRLAFEDASCMAVGLSCGAEQDEGCFSGWHPSMFAFCSYNNKEKVVAAAQEIGVGLGSIRDIPPRKWRGSLPLCCGNPHRRCTDASPLGTLRLNIYPSLPLAVSG